MPNSEASNALAPEGSASADLVHDHRGAYGPLLFEQFELFLDRAEARCRRQARKGTLEETTVALSNDEVSQARDLIWVTVELAAKPVRRQAMIHDLGVITLTLRHDKKQQHLLIDGAMSLDPYPKPLFDLIMPIKFRCEYPPAEGSSPESSSPHESQLQ